MFKLTSDNIDELIVGLPLNQLPPAFRDALEFALFCDVRYVWIDALCIKQDDRQDWSREAPLMGSIYHNSFCNLSAAGWNGPQSGLFLPRTPSQSAPIVVSPRPDLWKNESETAMNPGSLYTCMLQDLFKRIIEVAPVNDRAWVMQERVLSPRKIFFSEHQLFWECRRKKACEMFPDQIPEVPSDIAPRMHGIDHDQHDHILLSVMDAAVRRQRMGLSGSLRNQAHKIRLLRAWRALLRQYVSYGITYTSDRLVAINGITKYFEQALGDECVFGLWRSQLPFQLVFLYQSRTDLVDQNSAEGNEKVPSWSWAHHERKLQLAPEIEDAEGDAYEWSEGWTKEALITVLDITFNEKIPLPTEVDGTWSLKQYPACLHLLCYLFPCVSADSEDDDVLDKPADDNRRFDLTIFMGGMATTAPIVFDSKVPEDVSIMPVFWFKQKMGWALVVSRVGGEDSRIFRRTGFMAATASFWIKLERYLEVCGDEQDAICLV